MTQTKHVNSIDTHDLHIMPIKYKDLTVLQPEVVVQEQQCFDIGFEAFNFVNTKFILLNVIRHDSIKVIYFIHATEGVSRSPYFNSA